MDLMIATLLQQLVQGGGSDLHIATGQPPYGRFSGELRPMTERPLAEEDCNKLIFSMLNNSQRKTLEQTWELDCAYGLKGVARFRVNVYRQKGSYAACLRALGSTIPSVELLNLPPVVLETSARPRGLVLVTGPLDPARPPPWRLCWITSITPAANTSSRSKTRSNSCTRATKAWCTNAN